MTGRAVARRGRRFALATGFALAAGFALALVGCGGGSGPPPPTTRVDRGDVVSSVTASGSVVASSEQQLTFPDGGRLVELRVKVGDRVEPGQVLARLDDYALRQTLAQRQATLDEQEAVLGRIRADPTVSGAEAGLAQAQQIEDATEEQADATEQANASATDRARAQLRIEESARDQAQSRLRAARAACAARAAAAPAGTGTGTTTGCDTGSAETAAQQADSAVVQARTQVVAAEQQQNTDAAAGQVSIENARQGVVSAQNELDAARSDRPYDLAEQQGNVDDARAGVAGARRDVDDTVLTAPVAGVVAAVNGVPGEILPAPTGVTAQGPGGVPLPDAAGGTAAAGGGSFLVLSGADAFQVVVPFEESDATRLAVGQRVDITLDALAGPAGPGPALRGRVLAIAPTGTDLDGIVSFYATISIENPVPQLRSGQTAVAAVRAQVATGVLRVPSAAVGRTDGRPSVTVTGPDGQPQTVPFEPGLVGDDYTEVRSGLQPGQHVRLPQATVTATPNRGGGGPGGN